MSTYCKYYKQQKQVSYDSGQTWSNVVPKEYQIGELYEIDSFDCAVGEPLIRWAKVPGDYLCEGKNKYEKEIEQYSIDNGITWETVYPATYRKGNLIETNSDLCINKWEGHYTDETDPTHCPIGYKWIPGAGCIYVDPVKIIRCSSSTSTTLTQNDITYNPYYLVWGIIGDCVTEIGNNAFSGCTSLTGLTLLDADSITSIGDKAFYNCNQLTSIEISSGITSIGASAFTNCTSISGITINATTPPSLGADAFNGTSFPIYVPCDSFNEYTSGSGWSTYANRIYGIPPCVEQRKLVVTYLDGTTMYRNCNSSVLTTGDTGYRSIASAITSAEIGDCVISIGENTFRQCYSLTSIDIPSGITSIGNYAFYDCSGLTSIDIPSGVTSIGASAFRYCISLSGITVNATTPPTLDFNTAAFNDTNNCPIYVPCESVNIYKMTAEWNSYESRIQGIPPCETPPPAPLKLQASYTGGTTHEVLCNDSTTLTTGETKPSGYMYAASAMTSAVIGNCVTTIGDSAFMYCSGLTSCTIGSGVTSIGASAFNRCSHLTSIDIPSGITTIGSNSFQYCSGLTSCTIGSGVTSIGDYAFWNCTALTNVTIPNSVTSMSSGVFYGCSSLSSCTIGSGVTSIGNYAFQYCSGLITVTVEATTPPTLGSNVFSGTTCSIYVPCESIDAYKSSWSTYESRITCRGLEYRWIDLDPSTDYYCSGTTKYYKQQKQVSYDSGQTWNNVVPAEYRTGDSAETESVDCGYVPVQLKFKAVYSGGTSYSEECDSSTTLTTGNTKPSGYEYTTMISAEIGDCITSIGSDAFADFIRLSSVTISDSVTTIGGYAFIRCSGITSIDIPSGVTSIGGYAFSNCTSLSSIDISNNVTSIGDNAFIRCSGLTSVTIGSGITSIGNYAFSNCSNLTSITVNAATPPTLGNNYVFNNTNNCPIYVPSGSVNTYKSASGWSNYASRIQAIP